MLDMDAYRKQAIETENRLQKQVSVKEGHIVINVTYEYNIALDTCQSYKNILSWVLHLTEKTWMTTEVLERFIRVACHEAGLETPTS
jgi:hypothetical protein